MFNIAIFQDDRRYLLSEINVPVAYFIGSTPDMGYLTVRHLILSSQECAKHYSLVG